ncbi:response regulator transcription factor [Micromonospora sp. CPCC 205546]|uniref:response regulator n=1 Tax=Micromonospora sp. CPCC 205546 TaxID=3122397 RepID=UPI002FF424F6
MVGCGAADEAFVVEPGGGWCAAVFAEGDVLLVDDQPLIRSGFRALLDAEDDIVVVAEAADGRDGVMLAQRHLPDVALIDIQMPVVDGIEATRRIAADPALAGVHVVILTNYGLDEYVFNALRAGAAGFLVKDIQPEDFLHSVRVAARGDALLAPAITRKLIARYVAQPPPRSDTGALAQLTAREREAVALVARACPTARSPNG